MSIHVNRDWSGSRAFNYPQDEGAVQMAAAIIALAVLDWQALENGKLTRTLARPDNSFVYTEEVKDFFQSKWFEYLLSFALPQHTPEEIRKRLGIPEPRKRRTKCAKS